MHTGVYRAIVVDNADPEFRYRVRLKIPQLMGENVSGWANPIPVTLSGEAPAPGTQVWAAFEGGDLAYPVYFALLDYYGSFYTMAEADDRFATLGAVSLKADLSALNAHTGATAAHGATGAVVGTTNTQTLTNKSISGASNTLSNIAQSSVVNLVTDLAAKAASVDLTTHTGATTAHGATGAVVGTTNAQTLTNKTISGASNTLSDIASSSVTGLDAALVAAAPVGSVNLFAGAAAPTGWMLCDGSEVAIATYGALYAVVGTTYGALTNGAGGAGTTHFRLPNLKGRVPVGLDTSQIEFDALGETGGAKTHALSEAEMPSHTHTGPSHTHTTPDHQHPNANVLFSNALGTGTNDPVSSVAQGAATGRWSASSSTSVTGSGGASTTGSGGTGLTGSTGSGSAHNNLQPYLVMNYIIKT